MGFDQSERVPGPIYVLMENIPLIKFIRNNIRDSSGVFSISSLVKISMLSVISTLSLKLYLNLLVYDRNISLGLPRKSSAIFGNLWKSSEIFGKCSVMFVRPSDKFWRIFRNLRKVVRNLRKIVNYAVIRYVYIIKRTLHVSSKI